MASDFDLNASERALTQFAKANKIAARVRVSSRDEGAITFGKLAAIAVKNEISLSDTDHNKLVNWIVARAAADTAGAADEVAVDVPSVRSTSIQDAIENKARVFIGENVESAMDAAVTFGQYDQFNLGDKLRAEQIGQPMCRFIEHWISKKLIEMIDAAQSNDKEVRAAYKHINTKKMIKMLADWKQQCEQYGSFKKANRKQVVRKTKPAAVQVKSIKYCSDENKELGIKSIRPAEMIGKEQVWVYNTNTRKLSVFRASSRAGIQAKGSAIQNWDPETSEMRTLRKPQETIKRVMDGGKLVLRKVMDELTTSKQKANGRFNEHTIILRVL